MGGTRQLHRAFFLRGLTDHFRDELAVRDETCWLDELIALASRLDNRLRERLILSQLEHFFATLTAFARPRPLVSVPFLLTHLTP